MRRFWTAWVLAGVLTATVQPGFSQDNTVYRNVDSEQMQKILTGLGHDYKVEKNGASLKLLDKYQIFLEPFLDGKALVAGCNNFPAASLERINQWNNERALSRAIQRVDGNKSYSRLESDVHCELGVTAKMVDLFLRRYGQSMQEFEAFLGQKPAGNPQPPRKEPSDGTREDDPGPFSGTAAPGITAGVKATKGKVEIAFPSAARPELVWKISWYVDSRHGLVIGDAWLKREGRDWLKVLGDCRVAEIHVPYYLSPTRYFDINVGGQASTTPLPITDELASPGQNLEGKAVLEVRDGGVAWMENRKGEGTRRRRGQEAVLWAPLKADWYLYLIEFRFRDDGSISFRAGSTGNNSPKEMHIAHMHNTCWRLDIDLGKPGQGGLVKNTVLWSTHREPGQGQRLGTQAQFEALFNRGVEGGVKWDPEQFAHPRIVSTEERNDHGNPVSYELLPMRAGSARHFQDLEYYSMADFWVTPFAGFDQKSNQPNELDFRQLPRYVKANRSIQNQDIVLWYTSSALHVPRDEDMMSRKTPGVTSVVWSGFELRPRDLFSSSPLYSRKSIAK